MTSTKHRTGVNRWLTRRRIAAVVLASVGATAWGMFPAVADGAAKPLVISTVKTSSVGTVLDSGTTLYTVAPSATACSAACLKIWPEVLLPKGSTKAVAGSGVNGAKLGTIKRAGGLFQVTYGGKPLYRYFKDTSPGQVRGELTDKWGKWSAVVTVKLSGGVTTTTSPGGGGVGF